MRLANLAQLAFVAMLLAFAAPSTAVAESCECPKLACDKECEIEQSVTFYSEKCEGGAKVRSCARPTCLKMDPYPAMCLKKDAMMNQPKQERVPASVVKKEEAPKPKKKVGVIEGLVGSSWRMENGQQKASLNLGDIVNETETVKTGDSSRLEIRFDDGNLITLSENSMVKLSEVVISDDETKRNALLHLLKGKIRSKVIKKYKGAKKQFRVSTKSAVAGVRGTEFVVELTDDMAKDERVTRVSTFEGAVELQGEGRAKKALIGRGETAAFVERGFSSRMSGEDFLQKAYMTSVRKLSDSEKSRLNKETLLTGRSMAARNVASKTMSGVCQNPKAEFNQCRWKCKNNPRGEKTCRTDLPNVNCERSVCKADGTWEDVTRLPASYGHYCEPQKVVVGPCDY